MSLDAKPVHVFATSAIRDLLPEADRQLTATVGLATKRNGYRAVSD